MCGILLYSGTTQQAVFDSLVPLIRERGGDAEGHESANGFQLYSSVLSLRQPLCTQPLHVGDYVVQFNGELYNEGIVGNDVAYVGERLAQEGVVDCVRGLEGEFAYAISREGEVWFGKDSVGKRSLCYNVEGGVFFVSSCPPRGEIGGAPADPAGALSAQHELSASSSVMGFTECAANVIYKFADGIVTEMGLLHPPPTVTPLLSDEISFAAKDLYERLRASVAVRVGEIHPLHRVAGAAAPFAILFSGGIDCTLIAALCGDILSSHEEQGPGAERICVDLLNVAFQNPRAGLTPADTPDRKLAVRSAAQLNAQYPRVNFRLLEINVPYQEYLEAKPRVLSMIRPYDTEMDLSIAIAFYFAAGANGANGTSPCKVLLSGLGADELFAGYTRHERIFSQYAKELRVARAAEAVSSANSPQCPHTLWENLREELQTDVDRLWVRNLARDDHVISQWGKEARYPFLDQHLLAWAQEKVPLDYKIRVDSEGAIERKVALRRLASYMGLEWVAAEPKRAIQFGAKSAKLDLGSQKTKGTARAQ